MDVSFNYFATCLDLHMLTSIVRPVSDTKDVTIQDEERSSKLREILQWKFKNIIDESSWYHVTL